MDHERVLIVDDEDVSRRALRRILTRQGYRVESVADGEEALDVVAMWSPDIVLLDLLMPRQDIFMVLNHVRAWSRVPIIVLSACAQERSKIRALDLGADDYLTKPFGIAELLARMRAVMRRGREPDVPRVLAGDIAIDLERRIVTKAGTEVRLTATEYRLLRALARHANMVVPHQQLLRQVWGDHEGDNVPEVRVYMRYLRRKLEDDPAHPRHLLTELGVGYRLQANE
ncbi:MAG: response regulator transcription factor [Thermomicrobiales bacterium]|nr:response regulator transcription factor [Thermomicrobiales bacterium]